MQAEQESKNETAERQTAEPVEQTAAELKAEFEAARAANIAAWTAKPPVVSLAQQDGKLVVVNRDATGTSTDDVASAVTPSHAPMVLVPAPLVTVEQAKAKVAEDLAAKVHELRVINSRLYGTKAKHERKARKPAKVKVPKVKVAVKECAVWHDKQGWHVAANRQAKRVFDAKSKLAAMRQGLNFGFTHCVGANYTNALASMARWSTFRVPAKK